MARGSNPAPQGVEKTETGVPGFDFIAEGGLPLGRAALLAGDAGTGKTVFGVQFLAAGIGRDEPGVFVTFEEPPEAIRENMLGLGWPCAEWEQDGRLRFVDASPGDGDMALETGEFDLTALLARVENAIRKTGAKRVVVDSSAVLLARFGDAALVRRELFRLALLLKQLGVTALITAERPDIDGSVARFGVEQFVLDTVLLLRNTLEGERRRRTIEILKMRGAPHQKGEFPFSIQSGRGFSIVPLSAVQLNRLSPGERINTGNATLNQMFGGGLFRGSVTLVSGATGCGKTLMAAEFVKGAAQAREKVLYLAFEEGRDQLLRNARSWGMDMAAMESKGWLEIRAEYPETASLEDHLIEIKEMIDARRPSRVVLDSLTALERIASMPAFRQFVVALTAYIKEQGVTALYTATTTGLSGGDSLSRGHISTITDTIILLRYVDRPGRVARLLTVLKMRGSKQDDSVREFTIDDGGMRIGKPYGRTVGIVSGGWRPNADLEEGG